MAKKEEKPNTFDDMAEGLADRPEGPTEGGALSLYSGQQPEFSREDVMMPFLRLAQGLSAEVQNGVAHPGQWLLQGFDPADTITIVPLMFARMRELRDEDTREVLCFSKDSYQGEGEPGGECAACPLNQWQGEKGAKTPPECTFMYAYVTYVVEHDALATLRFQRTSIKAGKMLNTVVAQRGLGRFGVELSSSSQSGRKGTYSIPVINPVSLDEEVLAAAVSKARG